MGKTLGPGLALRRAPSSLTCFCLNIHLFIFGCAWVFVAAPGFLYLRRSRAALAAAHSEVTSSLPSTGSRLEGVSSPGSKALGQ